jgi:hypothetical protein
LQRLQNKVLSTIGSVPRRTPARDLHVTFKIPYFDDFVAKLCMQQAEFIQNHGPNVRDIGQGEVQHRMCIGGSNLATAKRITVQMTDRRCSTEQINAKHNLLYKA